MKSQSEIKQIISAQGLKATLQRIAVYEALMNVPNHPTVEMLMEYIGEKYPSIATGTVYKTLENFAENNLVKKLRTENEAMRYDVFLEKHFHLIDSEKEKLIDYYDSELSNYLENYFKQKNIPNFSINDIKIQIIGKYLE